jgi:uridylate kinase
VLRAGQIRADVILKATKVDGVYAEDPKRNPNAAKFQVISCTQAIQDNLKVMDSTAFSTCQEIGMKMIVFDLFKKGNLKAVVTGKDVGTLVTPD